MRNLRVQVRRAFYCMRSFESSSEVHQLVDALSEQLSRVPPADVDSRLVATSLYGAQSLSDSDSLRSLINFGSDGVRDSTLIESANFVLEERRR